MGEPGSRIRGIVDQTVVGVVTAGILAVAAWGAGLLWPSSGTPDATQVPTTMFAVLTTDKLSTAGAALGAIAATVAVFGLRSRSARAAKAEARVAVLEEQDAKREMAARMAIMHAEQAGKTAEAAHKNLLELAAERAPMEKLPHVPIDADWVRVELEGVGFSASDAAHYAEHCLGNLQEHGIAFQDDARAFFDDADARRQVERLYGEIFQRRIDPHGYTFWASAYHRSSRSQKAMVLGQLRQRLKRMRDDGAQ